MKHITLKLKQKNEFEWQLKNGTKIVEKIQSCYNGTKWAVCYQVKDSLEDAVEYARVTTESMYTSVGGDYTVTVIKG
jgi:hypothetical protein